MGEGWRRMDWNDSGWLLALRKQTLSKSMVRWPSLTLWFIVCISPVSRSESPQSGGDFALCSQSCIVVCGLDKVQQEISVVELLSLVLTGDNMFWPFSRLWVVGRWMGWWDNKSSGTISCRQTEKQTNKFPLKRLIDNQLLFSPELMICQWVDWTFLFSILLWGEDVEEECRNSQQIVIV